MRIAIFFFTPTLPPTDRFDRVDFSCAALYRFDECIPLSSENCNSSDDPRGEPAQSACGCWLVHGLGLSASQAKDDGRFGSFVCVLLKQNLQRKETEVTTAATGFALHSWHPPPPTTAQRGFVAQQEGGPLLASLLDRTSQRRKWYCWAGRVLARVLRVLPRLDAPFNPPPSFYLSVI